MGTLLALLGSGCPEPEPPCTPKPVVRGPWSVGLYPRQAEVRWETAEDGCGGLRFGVEGGPGWAAAVESTTTPVVRTIEVGRDVLEPPDLPGTSFQHQVLLSNLEPNHCYAYQISQESAVHMGRFCTAPEAADDATVLAVIGDTNPMLGHTEQLYAPIVAAQPRAILHLGDIQYYTSVIETWGAWFQRAQGLLAAAPILPVVGNHEFEAVSGTSGNDDGDLTEYNEYFLPLWGGHKHPRLGNNFAVRVGDVLYILADSESDNPTNMWAAQGRAWIEQTLTNAENDPAHRFSVLSFHRPVYTRSKYMGGVVRRNDLEAMLQGHRVPLIMTGHAHCYERFEVSGRTVIVSGGGGALPHRCDRTHEDPAVNAELESLQRIQRTAYHWVKLSQTSAGIRGEAIAEDGTILDQWEVQ